MFDMIVYFHLYFFDYFLIQIDHQNVNLYITGVSLNVLLKINSATVYMVDVKYYCKGG